MAKIGRDAGIATKQILDLRGRHAVPPALGPAAIVKEVSAPARAGRPAAPSHCAARIRPTPTIAVPVTGSARTTQPTASEVASSAEEAIAAAPAPSIGTASTAVTCGTSEQTVISPTIPTQPRASFGTSFTV